LQLHFENYYHRRSFGEANSPRVSSSFAKMSSKNKRKNKKAQAPTKEKTESTNGNVTNGIEKLTISDRACTGVLASQPQSRDIKIENFSLSLNGIELITDTLV
jgi:ATP-binding cassette subfamily F protein 2